MLPIYHKFKFGKLLSDRQGFFLVYLLATTSYTHAHRFLLVRMGVIERVLANRP